MEKENGNKAARILYLYDKLKNGGIISKAETARRFGVNSRSIQRDLDDIRDFLEKSESYFTVVYDTQKRGYRLERIEDDKLTKGEVLSICKILLDSRAFPKHKMQKLLLNVVSHNVAPDEKAQMMDLISNEMFHYIEPRHKTDCSDLLWTIGQAIRTSHYIQVDYIRTKDKTIVSRKLRPAAIMFSEYYFYLTAFIDDKELCQHFEVSNDVFPTIYRIDRIKKIDILSEQFHVPYRDRFEEGEFRKRVQFMYGGRLQKVQFRYSGTDVDAILDRLPTAQILKENSDGYLISAEVFGKGIDMWLKSQGKNIEVLSDREV